MLLSKERQAEFRSKGLCTLFDERDELIKAAKAIRERMGDWPIPELVKILDRGES